MEISWEQSVLTFAEQVEGLLLQKESCNNLMLGIIERLKAEKESICACFGVVEEKGRVIYAFMRTPPNQWIIADVADASDDMIDKIVHFFWSQKQDVPGVIGPVSLATRFAQTWGRLTRQKAIIQMEQFIYQLDKLETPALVEGRLVLAKECDLPLIANWLFQFGKETGIHTTREQAHTTARYFIAKQSAFLWKVNNDPVCMVNNARTTRNGATINAVFTPDKFKRNGYASSAVAALSEHLLKCGKQFCNLYTDLANPTSNGIYQKIGYKQVGASIVFQFQRSS